jgi:23S rRNA (pseudouridine1915-N3)-methyltransferase
MLLRVIAAGTRMPAWVQQGFEEYARRLRGEFTMELVEIPLGQRGSGDTSQAVRKEGEKMLAHLRDSTYVVALQVGGRAMSSNQLAQFLTRQSQSTREIAFCIGGPDGLAPEVDARANLRWSLSALTLPHALVRVIVAEALYRAVMIAKGHPYHRG